MTKQVLICVARAAKGMSNREVAALVGIREDRLSRISNGWALATRDEAARLAAVLDIEAELIPTHSNDVRASTLCTKCRAEITERG